MPVYNVTNTTDSVLGVKSTSVQGARPLRAGETLQFTTLTTDLLDYLSRNLVLITPTPQTDTVVVPPTSQTVTGAAAAAGASLDNGTWINVGPVAANLTIANPVVTNTTKYVGQRLRVKLTKDATAGTYSIAYGSQFKSTTLTAFAATASVNYLMQFEWDGSSWVQQDVSAAYV